MRPKVQVSVRVHLFTVYSNVEFTLLLPCYLHNIKEGERPTPPCRVHGESYGWVYAVGAHPHTTPTIWACWVLTQKSVQDIKGAVLRDVRYKSKAVLVYHFEMLGPSRNKDKKITEQNGG